MLAEKRANSPASSVAAYSLVEGVAPAPTILRIRDSGIPISRDRIRISDQVRFTFLFSPIVLIALQSYYR